MRSPHHAAEVQMEPTGLTGRRTRRRWRWMIWRVIGWRVSRMTQWEELNNC